MTINVLGPVRVGDGTDGTVAPRDRVVLGALVVRLGQETSPETLADALWPGQPPMSWNKVVQGCIVRLRRLLGADTIQRGPGGYRLDVEPRDVDAWRFEELLRQGTEQLALGEADRAAYTAEEALRMWRGRALPELEEWEPGRAEATRLEELRLQAQDLLVEARLVAGQHHDVVAEAHTRVLEQPLREHRWQLLARAQYQAGLQADALATLREARERLADELGLDPSPALVELEAAVLRQDPALDVPTAERATVVPPYLGLVPFDVDDATTFFGRDREVEECLALWTRHGVVAVVGPSGSGKSSLVRAGVAARLQAWGKRVTVITPGERPHDTLRSVLTRWTAGGTDVLVVDQAEELVTLCRSEEQRRGFVADLVGLAPGRGLVLAIAADRLGELTAYPDLVRLIEPGLFLLTRIEAAALREVIERPARYAGLLLEPGLVDLLIRDVDEQPGALPMLSHALRQTWERREGRTLTVAGYEASGGIHGAVSQSAERIYGGFTEEEQTALRDLLLRLVTPSPDRDPVLSRVPRVVVAPDPTRREIVERLVQARLLTSDEKVVEIAHASLVRGWPRLRGWLADDLQGQLLWHHLTDASLAWDQAGRPPDELYRGTRLAATVEWARQAEPSFTEVERQFLDASVKAHERELAREAEEARRQRRSVRRLRALVAAVAVAAIATTFFGLTSVRQAERADAEAVRARAQELAASSLQEVDESPDLARTLAVAAASLGPATLQTSSALHRAAAADAVIARLTYPHQVGHLMADIHPDGDRVAITGEWMQGARAIEVQTVEGEPVETLTLPDEPDASAAFFDRAFFTPDGSELVAGVIWAPDHPTRIGPEPPEEPPDGLVGIHVYDADTLELTEVIDVGPCGAALHDATTTHATIYVTPEPADCRWDLGEGNTVELVERATGDVRVLSRFIANVVGVAQLSADGRVVAYERLESPEGQTQLVVEDLGTGKEIARWRPAGVRAVSPDGRWVLQGFDQWLVYDVESPDADPVPLPSESGSAVYAAFGPEPHRVNVVGGDGVLRSWDVRSGDLLASVAGLPDGIVSIARNGVLAVSEEGGNTVRVVDPDAGPEGPRTRLCALSSGLGNEIVGVTSGLLVNALCDDEPLARLWHVDTGAQARVELRTSGITVAASPDGSRWLRWTVSEAAEQPDDPGPDPYRDHTLEIVTVGSEEGPVQLDGVCAWWGGGDESRSGCRPIPEEPFSFFACHFAWSPDGALLAGVGCFGLEGVAVWDALTGDLLHAASQVGEDRGGQAHDAFFTADSDKLAVSTYGSDIVLVDARTGAVLRQERLQALGAQELQLVGLSAAGELVAVTDIGPLGGETKAVHLIDLESLQVTASRVSLHETELGGAALSRDGSHLATADASGQVRVWDVASLDLVHEISVGTGVLAVHWTSPEDLVVLRADGVLLQVTTDPEQLLSAVREGLHRPLSTAECRRLSFGASCPTVGQLARWPAPPEELEGTYDLEIDAGTLARDMVRAFEERLGASLDEASEDELAVVSNDILATAPGLRLRLQDGGFVIDSLAEDGDPAGAEPFCEGSYTVANGRLVLQGERGRWCFVGVYLDAAFSVEERGLRLDGNSFRAPYWERYLWGDRLLERQD